MTDAPLILPVSAVSLEGRGILLRGASGRGKSALALALMARGAALVSDDRTCLGRRGARLVAWAPEAILGLIEARGVGILTAQVAAPAEVELLVDLDATETERLPPRREERILGRRVQVMRGSGHPFLADVLIQYMKHGLASV